MSNEITKLNLDSLGTGIPVLDQDLAGMMKKSAMVCLNHHQHKSEIKLFIEPSNFGECSLYLTGEVTEEILRKYAGTTSDSKYYEPTTRITDDAACGIALLFIREKTKYTAITKAAIGTTIDYYLSTQTNDSDLIFNNSEARLEVSGILSKTKDNTPQRRLKEKQTRLLTESNLPTFIVIVEFSSPYLLVSEEI